MKLKKITLKQFPQSEKKQQTNCINIMFFLSGDQLL